MVSKSFSIDPKHALTFTAWQLGPLLETLKGYQCIIYIYDINKTLYIYIHIIPMICINDMIYNHVYKKKYLNM